MKERKTETNKERKKEELLKLKLNLLCKSVWRKSKDLGDLREKVR